MWNIMALASGTYQINNEHITSSPPTGAFGNRCYYMSKSERVKSSWTQVFLTINSLMMWPDSYSTWGTQKFGSFVTSSHDDFYWIEAVAQPSNERTNQSTPNMAADTGVPQQPRSPLCIDVYLYVLACHLLYGVYGATFSRLVPECIMCDHMSGCGLYLCITNMRRGFKNKSVSCQYLVWSIMCSLFLYLTVLMPKI